MTRQRGFTLIEVLVATVILAILSIMVRSTRTSLVLSSLVCQLSRAARMNPADSAAQKVPNATSL